MFWFPNLQANPRPTCCPKATLIDGPFPAATPRLCYPSLQNGGGILECHTTSLLRSSLRRPARQACQSALGCRRREKEARKGVERLPTGQLQATFHAFELAAFYCRALVVCWNCRCGRDAFQLSMDFGPKRRGRAQRSLALLNEPRCGKGETGHARTGSKCSQLCKTWV